MRNHTQNSLHISDKHFSIVSELLADTETSISDDIVINALTSAGLLQYQAEMMVAQREKFAVAA